MVGRALLFGGTGERRDGGMIGLGCEGILWEGDGVEYVPCMKLRLKETFL